MKIQTKNNAAIDIILEYYMKMFSYGSEEITGEWE